MPLAVTEPPADMPVTLDEAKAFARIDFSDEDVLLANLIEAARDHVEQATGRTLVSTGYKFTAREFDCIVSLPRSPLISVDAVSYRDADGTVHQLVENTDYIVDAAAEPPTIEPVKQWPSTGDFPDAVQITFTAGYQTDSSPAVSVPARAKVAVKALTAHWFDERSIVPDGPRITEVPYHVTRLLNGLRVWR